MADAKKCDRCGRLYEYRMTPYTFDIHMTNETMDLCPECTREIFKLISRREDKDGGSSNAV